MLQSVRKVGAVLALFTAARPDWGVREVADALGVPPSSAHNVLASLTATGLLERQIRGRYRLGWRIAELHEVMRDGTELITVAAPIIQVLSRQTGETVHLAVPRDDDVLYLDKVVGSKSLSVSGPRVGSRASADGSAIGKVFLAYRAVLQQHVRGAPVPRSPAPPVAQYRRRGPEELCRIRASGVATELSDVATDVACVAAPVRDHTMHVVAALGISIPAERYERFRMPLTEAVRVATAQLSLRMGAQIPPALAAVRGESIAPCAASRIDPLRSASSA